MDEILKTREAEHYCNGVVDPGVCCPIAHGETDERFCTCKVSPEMRDAVDDFFHALYLESYRQFMKEERQWILRDHRTYLVEQSVRGPYLRCDCRLKSGSSAVDDGNVCGMCKKEIDWVSD